MGDPSDHSRDARHPPTVKEISTMLIRKCLAAVFALACAATANAQSARFVNVTDTDVFVAHASLDGGGAQPVRVIFSGWHRIPAGTAWRAQPDQMYHVWDGRAMVFSWGGLKESDGVVDRRKQFSAPCA